MTFQTRLHSVERCMHWVGFSLWPCVIKQTLTSCIFQSTGIFLKLEYERNSMEQYVGLEIKGCIRQLAILRKSIITLFIMHVPGISNSPLNMFQMMVGFYCMVEYHVVDMF